MNLRRMYNAVISGMIVLLIITIFLVYTFNSLINRSRSLNQDGIRLITLSNEVLRTNDYLIKLMRSFVLTDDPEFLEEYQSLLTYDSLEGKLDQMAEIGLTKDEGVRVRILYVLLGRLAQIEALAIDAYNSGDKAAATALISGEEYINTDFQLANTTTVLISGITSRVNTGVAEIQSQLRAMELLIGIFMSLSISGLIALQIMQRNRVLKPIMEIEGIMREIADNNVGNRLTKRHNDEIGSLVDHVNTMADSIEAHMQESKNSLNILKSILDGIDASIYVTVPETGEILFINKHMKNHFNIEGEAIGRYCYKILQGGMKERCDFCPCFRLDEDPDAVVVWEEHNTVTHRIYQNTDRYIDWIGGVKAHLQHSVDITDIKFIADDKLRAEREALEMKHEKEKAEASAKAKNDFLAKMSHEIRTPMNAVMGMSEIVLRKNPPQDIYENVLGIKSASLNLLSIINDILDFSKIESGMMEITETDYEFPSLINDVISIIRIRLIDKPIQFTASIDPDLPAYLKGDEIRIRQTLINILSNAVKYTNSGYISMTVTGVIEDDTVTLSIAVADSGIGVEEENIGKLFGDFVQIDTIKNRGIEGTGLGLAISRNLCRMMGGDITLKSEYGVGSTFTITLPQRFVLYMPFAHVESSDKKSILLYETRQLYRDSLINAFEQLGIAHESVESIPALFDRLEQYDYVFISSFMYGSIHPALSKLKNPPSLVLLADVTETFAVKNVKTLTLPAHSLSIANILNNVYEEQGVANVTGASFTAPDAKVMVVDDVAANLKVCEGLLMPYEMQLTLCLSAREALELIAADRYDLVFMDHMMPEMDGLEVTGFIREMEGEYYQSLPIIALTANAVSGVREMFIQNGMNDFLSKPIETKKLDAILEKWIPKEKRKKASAQEQSGEENAFVEKLRSVPELSVDKALAVMGGSGQTYERVVKLSVRLLPENIARLNHLIQDNLPNYAIEVHGIKGVLNNLGAYDLGSKAFELEDLSKQGDHDTCAALHPYFMERLTAFSDSMQALLDEEEIPEKPTGDATTLLELLPQLEEAADFCDNASALKLLTAIHSFTYGQELDKIIADTANAFERFDFDGAIELLKQLKGGIDQ